MQSALEDLKIIERGVDRLISHLGKAYAADIPLDERHIIVRSSVMRQVAEMILTELPGINRKKEQVDIDGAVFAVRFSHMRIIEAYSSHYAKLLKAIGRTRQG